MARVIELSDPTEHEPVQGPGLRLRPLTSDDHDPAERRNRQAVYPGRCVVYSFGTETQAHIVPEDEVLRAHARNSKIVDVIADLMGTDDITLYGDQLFMKPPRHGSAKEWHQDSASFKNIFPMNLISAWAAIDNVTIENGCLWMVPGSQRWAVIPPSSRPTIEGQFGEEYPTVPVPLRAGSVSFHHSLTYHASGPNETDTRRRGYATHYMRSTSFKDQAIEGSPAVTRYTHIRGQSYPGTVSEDVLEA